MALAKCGFNSVPGGASGVDLLVANGPTLLANIGFDPNFKPGPIVQVPIPGVTDQWVLVDTGATESCIDSQLAFQLGLPIVDQRRIGGIQGLQQVNMHLAQVCIPSLGHHTIYGAFAGVHLVAGGQAHKALLGRTFLQRFTMVYEGRTGTVTLSD